MAPWITALLLLAGAGVAEIVAAGLEEREAAIPDARGRATAGAGT